MLDRLHGVQFSSYEKAKVESAVQVVERWILMRIRNHRFECVDDVNDAIEPLLAQLNTKPFQKLPGSRASAFAELDAPALEARLTTRGVELLHRGQRVAAHARSAHQGGFTTVVEHLPAAHRAHLQWTPERLVHWGQSIGVATGRTVQRLLEEQRHPEHGYRACLGLLSLVRKYGKPRLEAACLVALELGTARYSHVRDILANGRDRVHAADTPQWTSPQHAHVRGPGYYQ